MTAIRTLRPAELPLLRGLLLGLSPEDRALRFTGGLSDAGVEAHCRRLAQAGRRVRVLGAFAERQLVGAAELWFDEGPAPRTCEAAFAVEATWRGRGLGTALLGRAVLVARNRWTRRLQVSCLVRNRRMQSLARRFARELRFEEGSAEAEVLLPYPSWGSFRAEAVMDLQGLLAGQAARPGPVPQRGPWRACLAH